MRLASADNATIAQTLERVADLLEAQEANPYRPRAYRAAADTVRTHPRPMREILEEGGAKALRELPAIGDSIAAAIEEILKTGRLRRLDHLRGELGPEELFTSVPGIGRDLAQRIHQSLGVDSLEALEVAANDGRLARVRGFGPRRVLGVRTALASLLKEDARRRASDTTRTARPATGRPPTVATLLDVDADYRTRAEKGRLRKIAPRRFNPNREAWLPIYHTEGGAFSFTVMYSNTARAHALGTTHDWVVIFYEKDGEEGRVTVVTEHLGRLRGRRVVRGREEECARHYAVEQGGP